MLRWRRTRSVIGLPRRAKPSINAALRLCVIVVIPLTGALFRRRYQHADRIPPQGAAIVVVNHISYADPFVVARFCWDAGRVPRFLAKSGLFRLPVIGSVLRATGQIPVHRGSRDAVNSLSEAVAALDRGELVVIYPEGTVTRDEQFWPMTAKTGTARLWLQRPETPVIPVGQWGAQYAVDWYRRRIRLHKRTAVRISVGEPVDLTPFRDQPPSTSTLRAVTDTVMSAVRDEVAVLRGTTPPEQFATRPRSTGSPQDVA